MRWGIVGFGWVARDYMAPGIVAADGRVVAICDRDPDARAAGATFGAMAHADLDGLLGERLDAVYVATPNDAHRGPVERCLAAGVPVLCEKPLAATLDEAAVIVRAGRATGTLLGTAFDQRRHPAHGAIRDAIASGRIGEPTAVRIVYGCWLDCDWSAGRRGHDRNWRTDRARAGGGAAIDLAPHGLDLVDALLGEPVVALTGLLQRRVQAYDVDDGGMLVGRTASGVLVGLHNSYNTRETLPRRRLEVVGTRGQIVATDTMGQDPGGRVVVVDAESGETRPLPFDASLSPFTAQAKAFAAAVGGAPHDYDAARDLSALRLLLAVDAESTRVLEPT